MHGLLQRELASYLGLSEQGLWNILSGRSEPRTRTVQLCARDVRDHRGRAARPHRRLPAGGRAVYERAPVRELSVDDEPSWAQQGSRLELSSASSVMGATGLEPVTFRA